MIDLQIMHKGLTILKIVILFYVLNSEQVSIFLDFTRNSWIMLVLINNMSLGKDFSKRIKAGPGKVIF